jgi:hypothetical protein
MYRLVDQPLSFEGIAMNPVYTPGTYQLAWNATTGVATLQAPAAALPAGSMNAGTVHYDDGSDPLGYAGNHVLQQNVRDLLYKQNERDMQRVQIRLDPAIAAAYNHGTMVEPENDGLPNNGDMMD